MTRVKICGVRRLEDVEYINRYKPDFVGFIFAESKRRVTPEFAGTLASKLDRKIMRAGVFVNENMSNVVQTTLECGLDVVQIHGNEDSNYICELKKELELSGRSNIINGIQIWKAIRVKDKESINCMRNFKVDAFVLDAYSEGSYGGLGKSFDWDLAVEAKKYGKIILAGGLNEQNIKEALKKVKPYGVDTSSGVETDGFKDEEKIKNFVKSVRSFI